MRRAGEGDEAAAVARGGGDGLAVGARDHAVRRAVEDEDRAARARDAGEVRERVERQDADARHDAHRALERREEQQRADVGVPLREPARRAAPDRVAAHDDVRRREAALLDEVPEGRLRRRVDRAFRGLPRREPVAGILPGEGGEAEAVEEREAVADVAQVLGVAVREEHGARRPGHGAPHAGDGRVRRAHRDEPRQVRPVGRARRVEHRGVHDRAADAGRGGVENGEAERGASCEAEKPGNTGNTGNSHGRLWD